LILNPPVGVTDGMKVTTMNPANAFAARPRLDEISKGR
jgi:hypothetical protein